jgi:uncharacterized protein (TIGR02996 family)
MADVMAIVSKAVFEKAAGKRPALGAQLAMDRYVSASKNLTPVASGGRLFVVTVRPPDEQLWLIAVLDQPVFDGAQWIAAPSAVAITDITHLRAQLQFESGAGLTPRPGALGASLQTPRVLNADDVALLEAAAGTAGPIDPAIERRAQLLRGVLADPDASAPKQVFADHLLQARDPRGELIQLELALAGPLAIHRRDALDARHAELLEAHRKTWFPYKIGGYRTRGGFIRSVRATFRQLRAAGALFASEPVVEVEVELDAADAAKLATQPWLARLRHLIVRGPLGDDAFTALWHAAPQLRSLDVTACGLGPEALAGLGASMPLLDRLVLSANPIGDPGLANLRSWRHLERLETLYVSACTISPAGVTALLHGAPLTALDTLCLSNNRLDDAVAATIATRAPALPALRHLELHAAGVGAAGARAVLAGLPKLATLDARRSAIAAGDVAELVPHVRV